MLRDDRASREIGDILSRNSDADQKAIEQALSNCTRIKWWRTPPMLQLWQALQCQ